VASRKLNADKNNDKTSQLTHVSRFEHLDTVAVWPCAEKAGWLISVAFG
jgi:hypothetical protein